MLNFELEQVVALHFAIFSSTGALSFFKLAANLLAILSSRSLDEEEHSGCRTQYTVIGVVLLWSSLYAYGMAFRAAWLQQLVRMPITLLVELVKLAVRLCSWLNAHVLQPGLELLVRCIQFLWQGFVGLLCLVVATALWQFGSSRLVLLLPQICTFLNHTAPQISSIPLLCVAATEDPALPSPGAAILLELALPILAVAGSGFLTVMGIAFFLEYVIDNAVRKAIQLCLDLLDLIFNRIIPFTCRGLAGFLCLLAAAALWQFGSSRLVLLLPQICTFLNHTAPQISSIPLLCVAATEDPALPSPGAAILLELALPILAVAGSGFLTVMGIAFFLEYVIDNAVRKAIQLCLDLLDLAFVQPLVFLSKRIRLGVGLLSLAIGLGVMVTDPSLFWADLSARTECFLSSTYPGAWFVTRTAYASLACFPPWSSAAIDSGWVLERVILSTLLCMNGIELICFDLGPIPILGYLLSGTVEGVAKFVAPVVKFISQRKALLEHVFAAVLLVSGGSLCCVFWDPESELMVQMQTYTKCFAKNDSFIAVVRCSDPLHHSYPLFYPIAIFVDFSVGLQVIGGLYNIHALKLLEHYAAAIRAVTKTFVANWMLFVGVLVTAVGGFSSSDSLSSSHGPASQRKEIQFSSISKVNY